MRKAILVIILVLILLVLYNKPNIVQRGGHTPLTTHDKTELLNAMKLVHKVFTERQIPYMLAFGSVLGALRHKGFIPWDDDMDLLIFQDDIPRVEEALKYISNYYKTEKTWKLFKIHPTPNTYIDFFPVKIDGDGKVKRCRIDTDQKKCHEVDGGWWKDWFGFDKTDILPLKKYKFEDTEFYGPANGLKLAKFWYGDNCMTICKSRFHEDSSYHWSSPKEIPCNILLKKFKKNINIDIS